MLVVSVACSGAPAVPSASAAADGPVVVIQQPTDGALLSLGQNVVVSGAASDAVGIDHVTLLADGVSVASTPSGAPTPLVPFSLNWLAGPGGSHTLQVIAYRPDGTASEPAVIQVTVGLTGSGVPVASFITFAPFPSVSVPSTPAPQRTKKPRRTQVPTLAPTAPPATAPATATPTYSPPTVPPSLPPTINPSGTAPDDTASEPYEIILGAINPACPPGPPAAAVGCITEQISAPGGDTTDQVFFVPVANASYAVRLTACSDLSNATIFHYLDPSATYGCGFGFNLQMPATPPAQSVFTIKFGTVPQQTYNLYQFTVYQCAFYNCGNQ